MMYILISHDDWLGLTGAESLGQTKQGDVIAETAEAPTIPYTELTEDYKIFAQSGVHGKYGASLTIKEVKEIQTLCAKIGEENENKMQTIGELRLKAELIEALEEIEAIVSLITEA